MNYLKSTMAVMAGLALAMALGVSAVKAGVTSLNEVGAKKDFPIAVRAYESMNRDFSRVGRPRSVEQVRTIKIGSSKRQLVSVVGQPVSAYQDGSWNFNVALPLPQRHRLVCQYRVFFDDSGRVAGTVWRRPQCADIVIGKK